MDGVWLEIAAAAYEAYGAVTGGKNFRGEPMPAFSALPETIRRAWVAACKAAANQASAMGGE